MKPELLAKIPLPLAQAYLRARNAKSPAERHLNAYYMMEAMIKFLVSIGAQEYLSEERRSGKVDESLQALAMPSSGQWIQAMRELARHFSARTGAASQLLGPWSERLVTRTRELPSCAALALKIAETDGMDPGFRDALSLIDFFNLLPAYRNRHLGHSAPALESFHSEMGPLFLDACQNLLSFFVILPAGAELIFTDEKRLIGENLVVIERLRFMGPAPLRCEPIELHVDKAGAWPVNSLCLDFGRDMAPLCLFPLLHGTWKDEQAEVFFLNRSRGVFPEFLSYASGKVIRGEGFEEDFKIFLSKISRRNLDACEINKLREESKSGSPIETEPSMKDRDHLGGYALHGELGKGGMGIVYLAEQESLGRRVALKTLPFEKGRDPVRQARFLREVRALSACESPRVVKILDSGEERGVLWYTMELVDGATFSDVLCQLKPLKNEKKKLRGSDIWDAIQLSARNELERRMKILGVGELPAWRPSAPPERFRPYLGKHPGYMIALLMKDGAEALHAIHTQENPVIHRDVKPDNLMVTAEGELVLMDFGLARVEGGTTLTLADSVLGTIRYSPPEQIKRTVRIDTRADIYSLGASFHELATLNPLYDADSEVELITKITDETSGPEDIRKLDGDFPEDLGVIIQKCLNKDPGQRYGSASELSLDLQRFLDSRPILARKPSYRYYAKMFARKHRAPLATAAACCLALLVVVVVTGSWNIRERMRAEREAEAAREVRDYLVGLYKVLDPNEARGNTVTAREILDKGVQKIDRELAGQPAVQVKLLATISEIYGHLGLYNKAAATSERVLKMRLKILGEKNLEVAQSMNDLAATYQRLGRYAEAEPLQEKALAIREELLGPNDPEVAKSLDNFAALRLHQGRLPEAEILLKRAQSVWQNSANPQSPDVITSFTNLAALYFFQGRLSEAEPVFLKALAAAEKAHGQEHTEVVMCLNNLACLYEQQGRAAEEESLRQRAMTISEKVLGPEHPHVAVSMSNLASTYMSHGRFKEARPLLDRSLEIREKAFGSRHPEVATNLQNIALLDLNLGKLDLASTYLERALKIREELLGKEHPETARSFANLALLRSEQGLDAEAEPMCEKTLALRERILGTEHQEVAETLVELSVIHTHLSKFDEAIEYCTRSIVIWQKQSEKEPTNSRWRKSLIRAWLQLGIAQQLSQERARASESWTKALAFVKADEKTCDDPDFLDSYSRVLLWLGRVQEARPAVQHLRAIGWSRRDFLEICKMRGVKL